MTAEQGEVFDSIRAFYVASDSAIKARPLEWGVDPRMYFWRQMLTPIEAAMWEVLQASGQKFYPQYPIGNFFVDFAHPAARLVIECDGAAFHQDRKKDALRDAQLNAEGWTVFRITGRECMQDEDEDSDEQSPIWKFAKRVTKFVNEAKQGVTA